MNTKNKNLISDVYEISNVYDESINHIHDYYVNNITMTNSEIAEWLNECSTKTEPKPSIDLSTFGSIKLSNGYELPADILEEMLTEYTKKHKPELLI